MANQGVQSSEQAIGQWLDKSLNSMTDWMTEVSTDKNGGTDVQVIGEGNSKESISGKKLSADDIKDIEKAYNRPGGQAGLYTKTHKGEWVGTHTMEGMLVTAKANQELTQATNVLTKDVEQKNKVEQNIQRTTKQLA